MGLVTILFASDGWLAVAMQPGGAKDPRKNDLIDLLVKPPNADDDLDQSQKSDSKSIKGMAFCVPKLTGNVADIQTFIYIAAGLSAGIYAAYLLVKLEGVTTKI